MDFNGLRLKYALKGTSNFFAQKSKMEEVLDDNLLLEYIKTDVAKTQEYDAQNLDQLKKDVANARRMILEFGIISS